MLVGNKANDIVYILDNNNTNLSTLLTINF